MRTWFHDTLFTLHYEHNYLPGGYPGPLIGFDAEQVRRVLAAVRPDAVAYTAKGHSGWVPYPTRFSNRLSGLDDEPALDLLGAYREITRELGIRFVVGYSGLIDYLAADAHPGWLRMNSNYAPYPNRALCPNAGYVDELMLPQLDELLTRYEPDGLWVDAESWTVSPCYCQSCESEYQMLSERGLPWDRTDAHWADWLQFHRDSFQRYLVKVGRFTHDRLPDLVYASSGSFSTHQPELLVVGPDRLTRDLSPAYSLRQAGLEGRFLDGRRFPFDLMTPNRASARPWPQGKLPALPSYPKTADHLSQEGAVVLANGGRWSVSAPAYPDDALPEAEHAAIAAAAEFARARKEWSTGAASAAYVAVLHTDATHRATGNGLYDPGPSLDRIRGAHQLLQELHHPHDVVTLEDFLADSERYYLLVLPEQVALPPEADDTIRDWVRNGGRLIATGRVSPRIMEDIPTFALEDVLGVRWTGGRDAEGFFLHRGQPLQIAAPTYRVALYEAEMVQPLLVSGHELRQQSTGLVAASRHGFASGEAFYIAADFFAAYHRTQYPGLRDFFSDAIELALPNAPLGTDAPPTIEVTLRQRAGEMLIHLVDHRPGKSLAQNSAFVEQLAPTEPFALELALPARPTSIRLQPDGREVDWTYEEFVLRVEVPRFRIHSVIAIALGEAEVTPPAD
ncbi:MAG: alpha-L-fucosidase [Actinomycetota bacterium]